MSTDVAARVARGAALLHKRVGPDWWRKIPDDFDLTDAWDCIVYHVTGAPYEVGLNELGLGDSSSVEHGFDVDGTARIDDVEILEAEWRRLIAERRQAVAQPDLWAIHVIGPDDILPTSSREVADRAATVINALCEELKRWPASALDPPLGAEVVPWPYSPESHAAGLAKQEQEHR